MKTGTSERLRAAQKTPSGPVGGLLDPRFAYVKACDTNIAATFARIREQLAAERRAAMKGQK